MTHKTFGRVLAGLLILAIAFVYPVILYAQDLEFDPDDVEEFDSEDWEWDEEEEDGFESPATEIPVATAIIIPSEAIDPRTADLLTNQLIEELGLLGVAEVVPNAELRDEFDIMGAELATECAFDPVCLGRVGYDIGLDQVIIGRAALTRDPDVVGYTLDLVDLQSRSVLRYRFVEVDNNIEALSGATSTQLPYLFEIRTGPGEQLYAPTGPGTFQIVAAWSSLGLGAAAIGLGIVFGLDASSTEDDVRNGTLRGGNVYEMTQVQAQTLLDNASESALMSNIFLGSGVALVGVSVLLFLITPGSDIDANADLQAQGPRLQRPVVQWRSDGSGWGVRTGVTF